MYNLSKLKNLIDQDRALFHTQDLARIWEISNKNTLYTTIRRYKEKGVLYPVYKGIYSIKPIDLLDPWLLGLKIARSFAYISCESILARYGVINASPAQITIVSDHSKTVDIGDRSYRIRKLAPRYLYNGEGIVKDKDIDQASLERAVADMLYFNPKFHFDGTIDWPAVKKIQHQMGYPELKR